jgi:glucokinase
LIEKTLNHVGENMFNIGVDIGGTKIALGLVNENGEIVCREKYPTQAENGFESIIGKLVYKIDELISNFNTDRTAVNSIGVGVPGTVDLKAGEVILAANLFWENAPLVSELQNAFPAIKINADKDTNVTAWAEYLQYKNEGVRNLYFMTISTGIGSGIIIEGKLYRGSYYGAGEIGHMCIEKDGKQCTCGNKGCLQEYAKGPAIVNEAMRRIKSGNSSMLLNVLETKGKIENIDITEAAIKGDLLARSVIVEAAEYVGRALGQVLSLIAPDIIIIGGGIAQNGEMFLNPVISTAINSCYPPSKNRARIELTKMWEDAAIIGASRLYEIVD